MKNYDRKDTAAQEFPPPHPREEPRFPGELTAEVLGNIFAGCGDLKQRNISPGLSSGADVAVFWLDGLVDGSAVSQDVLRPLTDIIRASRELSPDRLMHGAVYSASAELRTSTDDTVDDLLRGCCAVVFDSVHAAVTFELRTKNQRSISEPTLEKSVKGGKDSFVEALSVNISLVRRRVCDPALKVSNTLVGRKTRTKVGVIYIEGVADPSLVAELRRRLDAVDVDNMLSTGMLEEYIVDEPASPMPQLLHTERPDRFSYQLVSGRVGILVDGIPMGFLIPAGLAEFMRVPQDETGHYTVSSALSLVRWLALILALILPAFYVAVAMYHQEMIPTKLLLSIISSKQAVPFSTALEVLGMLIAFDLLQEAGLRLPDPVGDTVSVIGALIVGQSAVDASVISPVAVIVVALSGIAGFALPSQDMGAALRIARFLLVLAAIAAGLFGVTALLCLMLWHLCGIESFGRSYTASLSSDRRGSLIRTLLRRPKPDDKFRKPELNTPDRRRQK